MHIIVLVIKFWQMSLIIILITFVFEHSNSQNKPKFQYSSQKLLNSINFSGAKIKQISKGKYKPFYLVETNKNKCSGFAINDDFLITAYHCVQNVDYVNLTNPDFNKNQNGFNQEGIVVSVDKKSDLALIKGSFKDVYKYSFEQEDQDNGNLIFTCGAPNHRSKIDCFRVKIHKKNEDYVIGTGFSRQGMSGSPLIDREKDSVLGVLIGVSSDQTFYVPIHKVFHMLDIYPEDVQWR